VEQLLGHSLPSHERGVGTETPILALDFITTLDCTLTGSPPDSPPSSLANSDETAHAAQPRPPAVGEAGCPS
jgi:hypothetical protein